MQNWTQYWDNMSKPEMFGANYDVYSTIYLWINSLFLTLLEPYILLAVIFCLSTGYTLI